MPWPPSRSPLPPPASPSSFILTHLSVYSTGHSRPYIPIPDKLVPSSWPPSDAAAPSIYTADTLSRSRYTLEPTISSSLLIPFWIFRHAMSSLPPRSPLLLSFPSDVYPSTLFHKRRPHTLVAHDQELSLLIPFDTLYPLWDATDGPPLTYAISGLSFMALC